MDLLSGFESVQVCDYTWQGQVLQEGWAISVLLRTVREALLDQFFSPNTHNVRSLSQGEYFKTTESPFLNSCP